MVWTVWRADTGLIDDSDSVTGNRKELAPRPTVPKDMRLGMDRKVPREVVLRSGRCPPGCGSSIPRTGSTGPESCDSGCFS